mmetsp:Transcript_11261/g.12908  ORF Transcript_11261/g.12908 Transcript_11261/m.12908 type:complete len:201 (-) Transcript_11261:675-1277(-)|eukprot:CAMPEP_0184036252 /NCGR_PEP_ID=MMETSP0955-20130417/31034_1 /TAXON_ID=627963 /ORGANISM="Aplanochytrium sp, Strain PBS07" /LENGTH=200 /DNA_ID=CAMNT_0026323789 /DNA_START=155 /DNA_END=757 /DNA_ORIENTATION=+
MAESRPPTLADLDFASIRSAADIQLQADILNQIAQVQIDKMVEKNPQIKKLEEKGVPPVLVVSAAGLVLVGAAVFILLAYGAQMLSVFVSVLQPLYYTFKALETEQKDDDTMWLTYWFVHGVFYIAENSILIPIINILPAMYWLGKMIVQVWMVNFEGHIVIYDKLLAPFFRKNEAQFDHIIDEVKDEALDLVAQVKKEE